jgi:hypothetical protein
MLRLVSIWGWDALWGCRGGIITFAHSLHCAYLTAIFHSMEGEVDLGDWLLLADRPDRIIDLDPGNSAINHGWLILPIHD